MTPIHERDYASLTSRELEQILAHGRALRAAELRTLMGRIVKLWRGDRAPSGAALAAGKVG